MTPADDNPYRALPQVQKLLEADDAALLIAAHGRMAATEALRGALAQARGAIAAGGQAPDAAGIVAAAGALLAERSRLHLRRVINATGIVLHTNLGRAPMAPQAVAAMAEVASGYANLEYDLATGARGSRTAGVEPLIAALARSEAGLAVNNGAGAILLALAALAGAGEVVVSRGELVEIGGGFRIPDVIAAGGARLVEVGSTNKTRIGDYEDAIGPDTRVLLKVHQSNFRTIGFTAETGVGALAALTRARGLMLVADLGSGLLRPSATSPEPTLQEVLAGGADLVTCSGDKLLGGPQAGLIAGTTAAVDRVRRHPLLRALRLDKMALAGLEATLLLHRDRPELPPVLAMLAQDAGVLRARAKCLRGLVGAGEVAASLGFAGGGALPEEERASVALAFDGAGLDALAARLRTGRPPVVARIHQRRLLVDMLAVSDAEVPDLAQALRTALA